MDRRRHAVAWRRGTADEGGASLVLVLAFLSLTALLAVALLTESHSGFTANIAVQHVQDTTAAANAGVQYGIQTLQTDTTGTMCGQAAPVTLSPMTVNGRSVTVTCQGTQNPTLIGSPGTTGWAIIANYPGGTVNGFSSSCAGGGGLGGGGGSCAVSFETGSSTSPPQVIGNVWTAGPWLLSSPGTPKVQIAGNLYEQGPAGGSTSSTGGCNPPGGQGANDNTKSVDVVTPGTLEPCNTPYIPGPNCAGPCAAPIPVHALPSSVPSILNPPSSSTTCSAPSSVIGTFTVLRPGHYTTVPSGFLTGQNYMRSGVYYFDSVGDMYVGGSSSTAGTLIGGQPAGGTIENSYILDPTGCAGLADPPGSGSGVEIVLGGNSTLHVEASNSQMELFSRQPGTPDGSTPGISIYQVQSTDTGWTTSTFSRIAPDRYPYPGTVSPDIVHIGAPETNQDNATNLLVSIHGLIFTPVGNVELTTPTNVAFPIAPGGVDVYALDAESTAKGTEAGTSTPPPQFGYFDITATAKGVNGDKDFTSHAVVYLAYAIKTGNGSGPWGGSSTTAAVIYSWRTCTQAPAPATPGTCAKS
jgi:hypothetical protein